MARTLDDLCRDAAEKMRDGVYLTKGRKPYKACTVDCYYGSYMMHLSPLMGQLTDATHFQAVGAVDLMIAWKLSPSTIANAIALPRETYRQLIRTGVHTGENPFTRLELPAKPSRMKIISADDMAYRIDLLPTASHRSRAWLLATYAGLRAGELDALLEEDINPMVIEVRRVLKTPASRRTIPMLPILSEKLNWMAADDRPHRFLGLQTMDQLKSQSNAVWKKHGLAPITWHDARHTFASICIAAGVDIKTVSSYLGHTKASTTLDIYAHLMPSSPLMFIEKVTNYLGGINE